MINLLPEATKQQIRAARANVILIRYTTVVVIAFAFLVLVLFGSYILLAQSKASSEQLVEANDSKASAYAATQAEIATLSSNLSGARSILDQQLSYSKALNVLGQALPSGAVFDSVTLSETTMNGQPVTIKIYAVNSEVAAAVPEQLRSSPHFGNINIDSISEENGISGYPVSASLSLTINRTIAQ